MASSIFFVDTPVFLKAFFDHASSDHKLLRDGFQKKRKLVSNEFVILELRKTLEHFKLTHEEIDDFVNHVVLESCLVLKSPTLNQIKNFKGTASKEDIPIVLSTIKHNLPIITSNKKKYVK
jgi:hypothetical protein